MKIKTALWWILPLLAVSITGCLPEPEPLNGVYSGTVYVMYDSNLGGINTVKFNDSTVVLEGQLFTGESQTARLRYDTRNVVGEHSSKVVSGPSQTIAYYDVSGSTGIILGVIAGELYVHVTDQQAASTRTFVKQE